MRLISDHASSKTSLAATLGASRENSLQSDSEDDLSRISQCSSVFLGVTNSSTSTFNGSPDVQPVQMELDEAM